MFRAAIRANRNLSVVQFPVHFFFLGGWWCRRGRRYSGRNRSSIVQSQGPSTMPATKAETVMAKATAVTRSTLE